MNQRTEMTTAKQFANILEDFFGDEFHKDLAAELRRLHAINAELKKALEEALANHCEDNLDMVKQEQEGNVCARCGGIVYDPVIKQEQGEPVAWRAWMKSASPDHKGGEYRWSYLSHPIMQDVIKNEPLYTTPQQRTWVDLTDEERHQVMQDRTWMHTEGLCQAIEAKLKEKNT